MAKVDLSAFLRTDIHYQIKNGDYVLGRNNEFVEHDMNKIIDCLRSQLINYMDAFTQRLPFLGSYRMDVDYYALALAIHKFTRDIFGPRRLYAVLKNASNYQHIHGYMKKFGLKMNSFDPDMHRRIAYFFYWFGVYKPFRIVKRAGVRAVLVPKKDKYILKYFNEIVTYNLVKMMLFSCVLDENSCTELNCKNRESGLKRGNCFLTIDLDKNENIFRIFLSRLHSNKLGRSSLELLLADSCIFSQCKNGIESCSLKRNGFNKWRTF